ncbi:MAG: DUF4143 domain-containing protein, partial [Pseudomonadota bacterium]
MECGIKQPWAIHKPPKVYFYDNADVENNAGTRLENLVATTLLKRNHFLEDYFGHQCSLHYLRYKDGREVDFAVVINNQLHDLIEVKQKDNDISKNLKYYKDKLKPNNAIQLVANLPRPYEKDGIKVISVTEFFSNPP